MIRRLLLFMVAFPTAILAASPDADLLAAVMSRDSGKVLNAIGRGANPNVIEQDVKIPYSALDIAVSTNQADLVAALLSAGAKTRGLTSRGDPIVAAATNDTAILRALLRRGADPNVRTVGLNYTPLYLAAGCDARVSEKLRLGGDWFGTRPDCEENVRLLLSAGARPNDRGFSEDTPLMRAVEAGNVEICRLLIGAGAKLEEVGNSGRSALAIALQRYATERYEAALGIQQDLRPVFPVIELLLSSGADPNKVRPGAYESYNDVRTIPHDAGYTPLTLAARHGWYEVARLLLSTGADPSLPRSDGVSPLEIAATNAHPKTAALIRGWMLANNRLEHSRRE